MAILEFYLADPSGQGAGSETEFDPALSVDIGDNVLSSSDLTGTPLENGNFYTNTVVAKDGDSYDVVIVEATDGTLYFANADGGQLPVDEKFRKDVLDNVDSATPIDGDAGIAVCFAAGTMIRTPTGEVAVEALVEGDLVLTADHGAQPVRWVGRRMATAAGELAPIRIKAGALGEQSPAQDLLVSPWHRVLVSGWKAQALFGESEVLIPARDLVNDSDIRVATDLDTVEYVHVLFDRHEIIFGNGAPSESFHPAEIALDKVGEAVREEILKLFPELRSDVRTYGPAARATVTGRLASALR
ncbi:Hint domain-containing protein [Halovulum sp. GXIMD14794]